MAERKPKFLTSKYLHEWLLHILWGPIGAVIIAVEGIRDWFKYRPKRRKFYE